MLIVVYWCVLMFLMFIDVYCGVVINVYCGVVIDGDWCLLWGSNWCLWWLLMFIDIFWCFWCLWWLLMFIYWYLSLKYFLTSWLFWRSLMFFGYNMLAVFASPTFDPQREAFLFRIPFVGLVYSSINQGFIVITRRIRKFMVMAFTFMAYMATGSRKKYGKMIIDQWMFRIFCSMFRAIWVSDPWGYPSSHSVVIRTYGCFLK